MSAGGIRMDNVEKINNSVPLGQKIAFGFGMLANQLFPALLSIFIVVLIQDLGFNPLLYGIIAFVPRFIDAITDPLMGFISDNTKSKWGKRRQYVLFGGILTGVAFILSWQLYAENGQTFNFWYFLILNLFFYLGITIFGIPFVAMGYEMSDNFHERTQIMAVSQFIGQFAWVLAPWIWIIIYDPNIFVDPASGTRILSVVFGVICTLLAIVPAIFIKSKSTLNDEHLVPLTKENVGKSFVNIFYIFKDAFKKLKKSPKKEYFITGDTSKHAGFTEEAGFEDINKYSKMSEFPDAIFCLNDSMALGALHAISRLGLRVPEDVAIMGYDNIKLSKYLDLTTIDQQMHTIGTQAISRLLAIIKSKDTQLFQTMINPILIPRGSTEKS